MDAKLKLLSNNRCTRKSLRSMAATEQSIDAEKKRLHKMITSPIRKKRKITNKSTEKCLAGELCRQQEEVMIFDGEKVNAGRCHSCKSPCHYTCLYEKKLDGLGSEVYCTKCYRNVVVQAQDASVTFDELLKSKTGSRPERRAINIAIDCKKFVDNFILQSKLTMTVDEFYAWEKEKDAFYSKNPKKNKRIDWGVYFREKTRYLQKKTLMILLSIWHSRNMHLAPTGL